ncbi:MAG: tRNA (adenosine(37)-N6)-threonylcarbamoyltransferase complex ATPase subunit type 1 TsaE [Planctomycetota bacterium]|nr:tRNA (adenosine(37)-N6)-threonylcarbamoyltransferase complex ATPase subunit type 1 TsaE [Planctomycetota bacterium]
MDRVERLTESAEETFELARRLGEGFEGGEVLALVGDLGSGKTTFTRGLVCGVGCEEYMRVNSPTYVLEQIYQGRLCVRHYDAYRLGNSNELDELGFEEALGSGAVLVVEWADRVDALMPPDKLVLELSFTGEPGAGGEPGNCRRLTFSSESTIWDARLAALGEEQGR